MKNIVYNAIQMNNLIYSDELKNFYDYYFSLAEKINGHEVLKKQNNQ